MCGTSSKELLGVGRAGFLCPWNRSHVDIQKVMMKTFFANCAACAALLRFAATPVDGAVDELVPEQTAGRESDSIVVASGSTEVRVGKEPNVAHVSEEADNSVVSDVLSVSAISACGVARKRRATRRTQWRRKQTGCELELGDESDDDDDELDDDSLRAAAVALKLPIVGTGRAGKEGRKRWYGKASCVRGSREAELT